MKQNPKSKSPLVFVCISFVYVSSKKGIDDDDDDDDCVSSSDDDVADGKKDERGRRRRERRRFVRNRRDKLGNHAVRAGVGATRFAIGFRHYVFVGRKTTTRGEEEMDEPERDGVPETEGTTGERKCDRRREDVSRRDARVDGEEEEDDDDASERDFWWYAADEKRRSEKGDE